MSELFVVPEFPELEFKEKSHTYWLYGTRIPSVSELMRPLSDSMYKGIDAEILDLAAQSTRLLKTSQSTASRTASRNTKVTSTVFWHG